MDAALFDPYSLTSTTMGSSTTSTPDCQKVTVPNNEELRMSPPPSDLTNLNLRTENENLRHKISELKAELKEVMETSEQNYNYARKYRKKGKSLARDLEEAMERLSALTIENDKLITDGHAAEEDLKMLKLQLEAAHATHLEAQTAWNAVQSKNRQLSTTIDSLNEQLEDQRREISELCEGRGQTLRLLEVMHKALCQAESKIGELVSENQRLKSARVDRVLPELRLSDLTIPYKGELKDRIESIWKTEMLGLKQKLQMAFDESQKVIEELQTQEPPPPIVDMEEINAAKAEVTKYKEILTSVVGGLKQLAANEAQIEEKAFCEKNVGLQQFLALHALDIECFKDCIDTRFISLGVLGPENQQNRIEIVKQISEMSPEADAFISAVLIVNEYLNKEVQRLEASVSSRTDLEKAAEALGIEDLSELPARIEAIRKEVVKLVQYKKKLKTVARQLQKDVTQKESELSETSLRLSELESENHQLKCQLQVAENKQTLSQIDSDSQVSVSSIRSSQEIEERIQVLENTLTEKEDELKHLKELYEQSGQQAELSIQQLTQRAQSLAAKLRTIHEAYQQLKLRDLESKDRYKKKVHSLNKQHMKELNEQRLRLQEARQLLNNTNSSLQERISQTNLLSKKLTESLAESEKRNQVLTDEISRLSIANQSLETRLKASEEKTNKERQVLQAQATAKILAAETQMHEASTKEKTILQRQINRITGYIADELGAFYGISASVLDEEACHQLLIKAKSDLYRSQTQ